MIIRSLSTGILISNATKKDGKWFGKMLEETNKEWTVGEKWAERHLTEDEIHEQIEAAVSEHEQSHMDVLQGWHDECEKLKARIAELEAERQPVEISQNDADAIEWYKGKYHPWQAAALYSEGFQSSPHSKTTYMWTTDWVLQIIKRGYTVKPDPLRTRLAAILGNNHEQLDAVVAAAREGEVE